MLSLLLAALAQAVPDRVTIGETVLDGWNLKAETFVQHNRDSLPTIEGMSCDVARNGLSLRIFRDAGVSLEIKGIWPEGEDGDQFGYSNVESLRIDGQAYEGRWAERGLVWRFSDVPYPKPPPPRELPPGTLESVAPLTEVLSGFLAVRRPGDVQWHHVEALADEVTRAKELRIFFRGSIWRHGRDDPLRELAVPLARLAPALDWCRRMMNSDRALLLYPERAGDEGIKR